MVVVTKNRISPNAFVSWLNAYIDEGNTEWGDVHDMLRRVDFSKFDDFDESYEYDMEIGKGQVYSDPDII